MPSNDTRSGLASQINPLVVELAVLDWQKSLEFYTKCLGFEVLFDRPEDGFVFLKQGDAQLMFYQANLERNIVADDAPLTPPLGQGMNVQIRVETLEPLVQALENANVPFALDLEERSYRVGDKDLLVRQFAVTDPDGYVIRFSEIIG